MTRYVKRMLRRRNFLDLSTDGMNALYGLNEDYQKNPDAGNTRITEDQIVDARTQYYQGKLEDEMLKILYLERFSLYSLVSRLGKPWILHNFRLLLPEEDFGTQLQHMISFHTKYPFGMYLTSAMQFQALKLLLSNTMGVQLEVKTYSIFYNILLRRS